MWNRVTLGALLTLLGTAPTLAQGFLADQVQLKLPSLNVDIVQEFNNPPGPNHCGNGLLGSFICPGLPSDVARGPSIVKGAGTDALGALYQIRTVPIANDSLCTLAGIPAEEYLIERQHGGASGVIARIPRCIGLDIPASFGQWTVVTSIQVDATNGIIYLGAYSDLFTWGCCDEWAIGVIRITGITPLLDIIPTFQPTAGTLSFVTPKHPEALPAANRFMVFGGSIDTASGTSVPLPLDCNVPTGGNPQPGDYLTIMDTRPDPPLGEASYVIIGVEHQMEQRYGRQHVGGVLKGRNPISFVGCG